MISKQAVEEQLKRIGCNFRFWGRSEVNELGRILLDDEVIAQCVNGEYTNGFAMLVATNHRILLVDKKPFLYLTVEDLRYEMITEFNYSHRMMDATIRIFTANKTLTFQSWNQHRLRLLLEFVQQRVLEMRQQQHLAQQFSAAAAAQYAQMHVAQAMQQQQQMMQQQAAQAMPVPTAQQTDPSQIIQAPTAPTPIQAPVPEQQAPIQQPNQAAQPSLSSRFASRRAALGTYTRSKLPLLRNHAEQPEPQPKPAESGEVYQDGYRPQPGLNALPYEYEG